MTLYTAGHLHTAVPHSSHSRAPILHTAVPGENNEHGCVYLRCRAVCKLPGCVEGHPCLMAVLCQCIPPNMYGVCYWLCFSVLSPVNVESHDLFSDILGGCFADTGAISLIPVHVVEVIASDSIENVLCNQWWLTKLYLWWSHINVLCLNQNTYIHFTWDFSLLIFQFQWGVYMLSFSL